MSYSLVEIYSFSFKISANFYQTKWRHIPEDENLYSNWCEDIEHTKFKIKSIIYLNRLKQLQNTSIRKHQDCQTDLD
jgi:hypothetical protein